MATNYSNHPTVFLPPIGRLSSQSTEGMSNAIAKLRTLYWPPPLPAEITLPKRTILTKIHDSAAPDSGYASAEDDEDDEGITHVTITADGDAEYLEVLRADTLEHEFAVRWTTGFISRSDPWIESAPCEDERTARAQLLDDATALLSAFIGDETPDNDSEEDEEGAEPAMVRVFTFPTTLEGKPIEVHLHDAPMLEDDHTSVGLQSWGSCIRFGKRICAAPAHFSLPPPHRPRDRPLRILELGAGTGLLSILAAKLLRDEERTPTIIATDFHPDVLANLSINVCANLPPPLLSSSPSTTPPAVQVHPLDWESPTTAPPLDEPFDVILAADVIYHPQHASWIRGCVEALLRRPTPADPSGGVFWMFNAVRQVGRHEGLEGSVPRAFDGSPPSGEGKGKEGMGLRILEMEEAGKEVGVGRADECGYRLFRIGWVPVGVEST
ncbi:hypothetical protein DXG01_009323 [Tephrocybe rancida]|nr:hypothetical protein DXG01_009323 [Tephrocybe rancida]